jgi:hypothetical protein
MRGSGGTWEIRTDMGSTFSTKNVSQADGSQTFLMDRAVGGAGINQTVTFGNFAQTDNRTTTFNSRNGYGFSFTSTSGNMSGTNNDSLTFNANGTVTITGNIWSETDSTARTLTLTALGEAGITGSLLATGSNHTFTKAGTGTLTIGGAASTYLGATNLGTGTTSVSDIGAFNASALASINLGGGTLNYTGAAQTWNRSLLLNAAGGSIVTANGSGAIAVASNVGYNGTTAGFKLVLGGASTATNEIRGIISNTTSAAAVTKFDSGTWQITSAPTLSLIHI